MENTSGSTTNDHHIRAILNRITELIDNENNNLENNIPFDMSVSNDNKGRCLYELSILFDKIDFAEISSGYVDQMRILREKLAVNACRLESYSAAARVVADLFKKKLQDMDADGTYSNR
ncbi:hypothetical protein [Candidatus Liberibacter sp.]|uniref:hypothetical protein n=1 Tax=Candidatus Liberibacter sp. TaxID=34022 RepID=UPI00217525FE|nr:hypothetical protein [Candidatus Liberibacter sp.]